MPGRFSTVKCTLLFRGGIFSTSALASVLLVAFTAAAVAAIILLRIGYQVEQAADRRLVEGAAISQAFLNEMEQDLTATGEWLSRDTALRHAVGEGDPGGIQERLTLALGLRVVQEALVADPNGGILAVARTGHPPAVQEAGSVPLGRAFRAALEGETAHGYSRGPEGQLRQSVYVPVYGSDGRRPGAILRLSSFADVDVLNLFRQLTGLETSLFIGEAHLVTTFRNPDGTPITQVGPEPALYQEVVGEGRPALAWRDLPIGRVRSYHVPLHDSNGDRAAMLSVSMPLRALRVETLQTVIPILPLTLAITLGSVALAYLLARRVREPILALSDAAVRLGEGDLETPIPPVTEPDLLPLAEQLELARSSVKARLETIASAEARQREVFAALGQPVITTWADGRITGFNRAAGELLGGSALLLSRPIQEVLPLLLRPAQELLPFPGSHSVAGDPPSTWHGRVDGAGGRAVDMEVIRTRLSGAHLPPTDVYVVHDVSRHAEMNRFREQLLYNVAHELRSPLAILENALELLATDYQELSTAEFDGLMRLSARTVSRLRGLMEDLLSAGNIQSGRFQVDPRPVGLAEVVEEEVEELMPDLEDRRQGVERSLDPPDVVVRADRRYLRRVLINLLSNASKYSPAGTTIRVRAGRVDGLVRVAVEDEGPGIPPEQLAGIFERFYRTRSGRGEPGVGLGLAIVKGIVDAHGGGVGVESEVGRGTSVWFTLPLA